MLFRRVCRPRLQDGINRRLCRLTTLAEVIQVAYTVFRRSGKYSARVVAYSHL